METLIMEWDLTFLAVEFAAFCGLVFLTVKKPPDWIQMGFLVVVLTAMAVYVFADVVALLGDMRTWPMRLIASGIEHVAMLLYVFRQVWIKTEVCQSLKSPSPT